MRRYKANEKAEILKEVEDVGNIHAVCRKRGIAHTTVHNWLKSRKLEGKASHYSENRRLKKKVSDLELENAILKDLLKKTYQVF